jgi:hypothetical protein
LNERIAGFLIDECLSGELADLAIEHDYYALATTQMGRWRGRNDYNVARFAIDRDLVLSPMTSMILRRSMSALRFTPASSLSLQAAQNCES